MYTEKDILLSNQVPFTVSLEVNKDTPITLSELYWNTPVTVDVKLSVPVSEHIDWVESLSPDVCRREDNSDNFLFRKVFKTKAELVECCETITDFAKENLCKVMTIDKDNITLGVLASKLLTRGIYSYVSVYGGELIEFFSTTVIETGTGDVETITLILPSNTLEVVSATNFKLKSASFKVVDDKCIITHELRDDSDIEVAVGDLTTVIINSHLRSKGTYLGNDNARAIVKRIDALIGDCIKRVVSNYNIADIVKVAISNLVKFDDEGNIEDYVLRFHIPNYLIDVSKLTQTPVDVNERKHKTEVYYTIDSSQSVTLLEQTSEAQVKDVFNALNISVLH